MMIAEISELLKEKASLYITQWLGEESFITSMVSSSPYALPIILLLPILILVLIAVFFDFLKDSWKMIFAIGIEVLAIIAYAYNPSWLLLLSVVAFIIFFMLSFSQHILRWVYSFLAFLKIILLSSFIPIEEGLKIMILFLPICSALMFFACITD